jgi:hypothetical protein
MNTVMLNIAIEGSGSCFEVHYNRASNLSSYYLDRCTVVEGFGIFFGAYYSLFLIQYSYCLARRILTPNLSSGRLDHYTVAGK